MRIYLRPVTLMDGANIVQWRNSPAVANHSFTKRPITLEDNERFYNAYIATNKYKQFIVERIDDDYGVFSYPIASVYLKDMDYENLRAELCLFTSNDAEWGEESQKIAIQLMLAKAFGEYQLHKVYTYVLLTHPDEKAMLMKFGFTEEALLKDETKDLDGNFIDVWRLSLMAKAKEA